MKKVYRCCICKKALNEYKPIRLVEQQYKNGKGYYRQYYNYKKYDFCKECFSTFRQWFEIKQGGKNETNNN